MIIMGKYLSHELGRKTSVNLLNIYPTLKKGRAAIAESTKPKMFICEAMNKELIKPTVKQKMASIVACQVLEAKIFLTIITHR
jgi:hypothetical protein